MTLDKTMAELHTALQHALQGRDHYQAQVTALTNAIDALQAVLPAPAPRTAPKAKQPKTKQPKAKQPKAKPAKKAAAKKAAKEDAPGKLPMLGTSYWLDMLKERKCTREDMLDLALADLKIERGTDAERKLKLRMHTSLHTLANVQGKVRAEQDGDRLVYSLQ